MNILKTINSENFKKLNQFEKRKLVQKHILIEKFCQIGTYAICFDLETICDEKNMYFYLKAKPHLVNNITIGKLYKILKYKNNKIKLENDIGKSHYYSIKRFIRTLKLERKLKLLKLKQTTDEKK